MRDRCIIIIFLPRRWNEKLYLVTLNDIINHLHKTRYIQSNWIPACSHEPQIVHCKIIQRNEFFVTARRTCDRYDSIVLFSQHVGQIRNKLAERNDDLVALNREASSVMKIILLGDAGRNNCAPCDGKLRIQRRSACMRRIHDGHLVSAVLMSVIKRRCALRESCMLIENRATLQFVARL